MGITRENFISAINTTLCVIAAIHLTYSSWYDYFLVVPPNVHILLNMPTWGGKWKYLTFWNECIEALYFCYAVLDNLVSGCSDNEKKPLRKIRDYWFLSIVFPTSFFVSFTFWVLWLINRELVMPRAVDAFFPAWLNQSVHTFILIYSLLELLTTYHKPLSSIRRHCCGLWTITVSYLIWCNIVYFKSEMWVYPILSELNWPGRIVFFAASLAASTVFLFLGYYLNNSVWKMKIKVARKKKAN